MTRPFFKQTAPPAFTLIELLVVIAIIGVLAAFLMSALSTAREKGRAAQCISNLHQIHIALSLYADENNERFPVPGSMIPWDHIDSGPGATGMCSWMQQIFRYASNKDVFHCPSDNKSKFSYFQSTRVAFIQSGSFGSIIRNSIANPEAFVLCGDTISGTTGGFDPLDADKDDYSQNCVGGPANGGLWVDWRRHNGGQNILFADGHVKWYAQYVPAEMTFRYDSMHGWQ